MTPPTDVGTVGDFEAALEQADEKIRLTGNLALSHAYTLSGDTEIDLNGHDITANLNDDLFTADGNTLIFKGDGNVSNKKRIAHAVNGGQVIINGGNFTTQKEAFIASNHGKITLNDGHISCVECALNIAGNAELEMNGGVVETSDNMGIGTNGNAGRGGNVITMNAGKIDASIQSAGYEAIGVYIANNDTFVMNGGEIIANGGTGLCMRAGDVTIHGGTITATKTAKDGTIVPDGKIADKNTIMLDCAAVIYHESADYPGKAGMKLSIEGGTLTGVDHSVQVLSNEAEPQVFVRGGTLTPPYPEPTAQAGE